MIKAKNFKSIIFLFLSGLVLLSSCGVTVDISKRYHQPGFYMNVSSDQNAVKKVECEMKQEELQQLKILASDVANHEKNNQSFASPVIEKMENSNVFLRIFDRTQSQPANVEEAMTSINTSTSIEIAEIEAFSVLNTTVSAEETASTSSTGKSQIVALVLVLLVGYLGIHRFYLGYTTIGIIQLLTLGGCGIWALIDLIRIITGDLQPVDGYYSETL